ncbi:MAG: bifunctional phosphopantothenoylcysteine decarboxylase/phosphopantothenate--cysteine ligase CoaBC [Candidatus Hydrogenedentota bacterium]
MAGRFEKREIVLGVTGSIAAYKACEIASRLVERGARVTPVLTRNACQFLGRISLEAITGRRAVVEMFEESGSPEIEHIAVAQRADLYLIAPASADILAKAAHGIADDWLSTTMLATTAPLLFAPAMNTNMYAHPATQANIHTLQARGAHFVGPGAGTLACRTVGPGRLEDTPRILDAAAVLLSTQNDLTGRRVLITSGANHEPIDPVRFLGNRSSGRMGHALAFEALCRGAEVTIVSGPADIAPPSAAAIIPVQTAAEMHTAVMEHIEAADVFIAAAAVADYRPVATADSKHKRRDEALSLELVPTADIAAEVGRKKRPGQVAVGFAAETNDLLTHAADKLERKQLDLIVANEVGGPASAIGSDLANAHIIAPQGVVAEYPGIEKTALAARLFDEIVKRLY